MAHRKDLNNDLTVNQRTSLHQLMHDYLLDDVVAAHAIAHGGAASGLHNFVSHREIVEGLEIYIDEHVDALPNAVADGLRSTLLPLPMWNPVKGIPLEFQNTIVGLGALGDIRPRDDNTQPPRPHLEKYGPFDGGNHPNAPLDADGTGGNGAIQVQPNLPMPTLPLPVCDPGVGTANNLWPVPSPGGATIANDIGKWHGAVHNTVGGTMAEGGMNSIAIQPAAYVFCPWHAFVDHPYWELEHCAGHGWSLQVPVPGMFGDVNQGGAITTGHINSDPTDPLSRPDLVIFHIEHPSGGLTPNSGFYRMGWDFDTHGNVNDWTPPIPVLDSLGNARGMGLQSEGAGVALATVRTHLSGQPDLIVFWVENDGGTRFGKYVIGWNLDPVTGIPNSTLAPPEGGWSDVKTVQAPGTGPGVTGTNLGTDPIQGAGMAVTTGINPGQIDMAIFRVVHSMGNNVGHYWLGWHMDTNGDIVGGWSQDNLVPGSFGSDPSWPGSQIQGADIAFANTHGDGLLDLVFFVVARPGGGNRGYYRVGYHLQPVTGVTEDTHGPQVVRNGIRQGGWSRVRYLAPPGHTGATEATPQLASLSSATSNTSGAGVALANINANTAQDDLILFHIDAQATGPARGLYVIGWDMDQTGQLS